MNLFIPMPSGFVLWIEVTVTLVSAVSGSLETQIRSGQVDGALPSQVEPFHIDYC